MATHDGARLLALPPAVAADRSLAGIEDVRDYFEPSGVWLPGPERDPRAYARARRVFDAPVVHPPLGDGDAVRRHDLGGTSVVTLRRGSVLAESPNRVSNALRDPSVRALVCDDVTTTVRPTALETDLEGAADLAAALPTGETVTVLTGGLPASYDEVWHLDASNGEPLAVGDDANAGENATGVCADAVGVRVHGLGSVDRYGSARTVSTLALGVDGSIGVETLDADSFGLESVSGVGPKTARRLEERGIADRRDLLRTSLETLTDVPGIGRTSAERMHRHAEVLETGEPRRLTDDSLPGDRGPPPLCLDIETDGLSPTIVWQVGVYDPVEDSYRAFVERADPTDPGPVLEAFLDWLLGVHPNRALLTWNGWRFDYRHLGAFVARHVDHYVAEWESIPKFDLYHWAVTAENALLPGRTNELARVASALGYDGAETGIDGAETAAAYRRFVRTGEEPTWDRHEAYCEDDCRALWHVYDRLRGAPAPAEEGEFGTTGSTVSTSNEDEQTALGDF